MESKRLIIREIIDDSEYKKLLTIYNSQINMMYIMDGKYTWEASEIKNKWETIRNENGDDFGFMLVLNKENSNVIGECAILKTDKNDTLEIGYMIDNQYWGNGYGDELIKELINKVSSIHGIKFIAAGMFKDNIRSEKLVLKNGFTLNKEGISKGGIKYKDYLLRL